MNLQQQGVERVNVVVGPEVTRPGIEIESADGTAREGRRPTLSELVVADIQLKILLDEFKPGQLLPSEARLCDAYRVSRSVIRDAIRTLAARGFVDVHQGRGTTISEPSEGALGFAMLAQIMRSEMTMGDILEMRAVVEGQLLPLATKNRTEEDYQRVANSFSDFEDAVKNEHWDEAHDHHLKFHLELIRAIGVPGLELFMRPMQEIINLSSWPPERDSAELWEVDVHRAILRALKNGNSRAMTKALEQHFDYLRHEPYLSLRSLPFRDAIKPEALKELFAGIASAGTLYA